MTSEVYKNTPEKVLIDTYGDVGMANRLWYSIVVQVDRASLHKDARFPSLSFFRAGTLNIADLHSFDVDGFALGVSNAYFF